MFYTRQANNGIIGTNPGSGGVNPTGWISLRDGQPTQSNDTPDELRQQISDLETQQNNYLAQNGGYVNTDNLPILSGYWEKIDALNKQLETYGNSETQAVKPKSSLDELTAAYTDSVFGNTQDVAAWNAAAPEDKNQNGGSPSGMQDMRTKPEDFQQMMANAYGLNDGAPGRESNKVNKLDTMIAQRQNENGVVQDGVPGRESNKVNKLDAMIAQRQNENGIVQDGTTQDAGAVQNTYVDSHRNGGMPDERMLFSAQDGLPVHAAMNDDTELPGPQPGPSPAPYQEPEPVQETVTGPQPTQGPTPQGDSDDEEGNGFLEGVIDTAEDIWDGFTDWIIEIYGNKQDENDVGANDEETGGTNGNKEEDIQDVESVGIDEADDIQIYNVQTEDESNIIIDDPMFQYTFDACLSNPEDVIYDVEKPTGWLAKVIENKVIEAGFKEGLSNEELLLSVNNPVAALAIKENQAIADKYREEMFDSYLDGDKANAFRHAMFVALNTLALGSSTALDFANAHENREGNDSTDIIRPDGKTNREHMDMDLHNNALGIAIAQTMIANSSSGFVNYDELAEVVYDVVITQEAGVWIIEEE